MKRAGLFGDEERRRVEVVIRLNYCNPFMPERIALERDLLGESFVDTGYAWHKQAVEEGPRPNVDRLAVYSQALSDESRARLSQGCAASEGDRDLYRELVLYFLFAKYKGAFMTHIEATLANEAGEGPRATFYDPFERDMRHYFALPGLSFPGLEEPAHLFAGFYQIRLAFHQIFEHVIGGSPVAARLRASIWESIFTCDLRRYRRGLYARMRDIATLIVGPSGTGKELVARAIGLSQYIPFDEKRLRFAESFTGCFHPINLSALSSTLIESELFGHAKGAFTGAIRDRAGFLEVCSPHGIVFLDEIGDLDAAIQVKLLRVLQTRAMQRIGETTPRQFHGKVVTATNRDLEAELRAGRFREDLYYRLCSDIIVTPSLRELVEGAPEQMRNLLSFVARRVAGEVEAEALIDETERWVCTQLGENYPWPGNVRELEQCVRNIMVRRRYQPRLLRDDAAGALERSFADGSWTAEELLSRYCRHVYRITGSYAETARRLDVDRRTVRKYVERDVY